MNLEVKTRQDKLKKWVSITDVCVDNIASMAVVFEQTGEATTFQILSVFIRHSFLSNRVLNIDVYLRSYRAWFRVFHRSHRAEPAPES